MYEKPEFIFCISFQVNGIKIIARLNSFKSRFFSFSAEFYFCIARYVHNKGIVSFEPIGPKSGKLRAKKVKIKIPPLF